MGFRFVLNYTSLLNLIWFGCFLKNTESIPTKTSTLVVPGITNSSEELENLKLNSDESREEKDVPSPALNKQLEEVLGLSPDYAETWTDKISSIKNPLSSTVVPYQCDILKRMCWLNENRGSVVTVFVPIKLLPDREPPTEIGLKELYSLMTKENKLEMGIESVTSVEDQHHSPDTHRRRKRDTLFAEANDTPQQEWVNPVDNEGYQPYRSQRDISISSSSSSTTTTTEHDPTSTVGRILRNVDPQAGKQSKRYAEMDEEDVDNKDNGSPSPDGDYQEDEEDPEYQLEKRFAGPETTGDPPKPGDPPTKIPSQLYRRDAMNQNSNYPPMANPDPYYPPQRLLSPFDGIGYRSVDAMPMWYMGGYPGFWQGRNTRNPQQYRHAGGYGRGWPPMSHYYPPYGNDLYEPPSYPSPPQSHRGHYKHQYAKQSPYDAYKPFPYGYAQGKGNYKSSIRKPIETDAHMYYGK